MFGAYYKCHCGVELSVFVLLQYVELESLNALSLSIPAM